VAAESSLLVAEASGDFCIKLQMVPSEEKQLSSKTLSSESLNIRTKRKQREELVPSAPATAEPLSFGLPSADPLLGNSGILLTVAQKAAQGLSVCMSLS
jgi:hypothetical protein